MTGPRIVSVTVPAGQPAPGAVALKTVREVLAAPWLQLAAQSRRLAGQLAAGEG